ncbi:class I adenylate-forming enzyme family protein [Streptacidiphilus sp. N1-12]|uniref:Class I adenylate-forming enzyme family protein n=2 Tax=Streptacidiphilus alkalitolerans TaxID=3342712 RepID=A0ABV6V7W4_9ACTN
MTDVSVSVFSHETVLTLGQRARLAQDPRVGGGNLLKSAIAANPNPHLPFIHTLKPMTNTEGEEQSSWSLLDLDWLAQSWAVWYVGKGVGPRDRVAVFLDDSFAYHVHFYALAQIGAIAVLINSNASAEIATSLMEQTNPVGLFVSQDRLAMLPDVMQIKGMTWTQVAEELPAPEGAPLPEVSRFRHAPVDPVAILHSSGTTGIPKPTIHTHRSIVAGPLFRLIDHKEQPGAVMMTSLPQSHLGCVAYTTYAVLGGTPLVAGFDRPGEELAEAVAEFKPTQVMSFAHAYSELAALDLAPGVLDSVNVWISIGDAVHQAHIRKVLGRRSPDLPAAAFYDRLGTTELGWGVLLKIRTIDSERNDRNAGKPVGVADVVVLRKDGSIANVNEVGLLGAQGPAITPGYWNGSDITYRSMLSGFWLTGDMAYRDANGDHFLVDRAVDCIESPTGTGYSVFMEEALLHDLTEVDDVAVIAGKYGDQSVAVAVVTVAEGSVVEAQKLLDQANDALTKAGQPVLAILDIAHSHEDFPVGVTGKVLKRLLREKYANLPAYVAAANPKYVAAVPCPKESKES